MNRKPSSLQQRNCSIEEDNGPGQWFVVYFLLWNFIIENCLEQFLSSLSQLKQFLVLNQEEQFLPKTGWSQESFYSLPTRKVKPILKTKGICLLFLFISNLKALLFSLQTDALRYKSFENSPWDLIFISIVKLSRYNLKFYTFLILPFSPEWGISWHWDKLMLSAL